MYTSGKLGFWSLMVVGSKEAGNIELFRSAARLIEQG